MTSSCLECHQRVATQLGGGTGLHGTLGERGRNCAPCHSEHHGEEFVLVNRMSFAQAGVPDPAQFDHGRVGFVMKGRHLELECKKCHANADAEMLPKGETRYLGLSQTCTGCHHDPHEGRMTIGCSKCHGQVDWKLPEAAGHERFVALLGGHGDVGCRKCHQKDGPHSLERFGAGKRDANPRDCADCHESPHAKAFVDGNAAAIGQPAGTACLTCHAAEHTGFRDPRLRLTPEQHAASGFHLDKPHQEVACDKCHDPKSKHFAARYPGRAATDCRQCHKDVHEGQFAGKAFAAKGCIDCHATTHFTPHAFTADKHSRTDFPLTGKHVSTKCEQCHVRGHAKEPIRFAAAAGRCEQCHSDAHAGYFARFARELDANKSGTCAVCHATAGFDKLPAARFDHARWTGFAVTGAHEQAGCESCHPRQAEPDQHGRCFGRVEARPGVPVGCATCHKDPHEGTFDRAGMPALANGRTTCARCHAETSFRALADAFDHGQWTRFALTGAHARIDCTACHARLSQAEPNGRTWARARGRECSECHEDRHAGQFAKSGVTDCRPCHQGGESFTDSKFRHEIHSRFRLGDQHKKVPCSSCHQPFKHGDREVIRYKPLPMQCVDCHGGVDSPFKRGEVRR
jgi:hypothetical protein